MTTIITPNLGAAPLFTAGGVGATPGYDAIDLRRAVGLSLDEGTVGSDAWKLQQRTAGANMSVEINSSAGAAVVRGDTVSGQGLYTISPTASNIVEPIAAAHATLSRLDMVVLEILDDQHDGSGSSIARTRVITGTPASTPTLPAQPPSAMCLGWVTVPAAATTVTSALCQDFRPRRAGFCATDSVDTITYGQPYALAPAPDFIPALVVPTGGIIAVMFAAEWKSTHGSSDGTYLTSNASLYIFSDPRAGAVASWQVSATNGSPSYVYGPVNAISQLRSDQTEGFHPLSTSARGLTSSGHDMNSSGSDYNDTGIAAQAIGASDGGPGVCLVAPKVAGTYSVGVQYTMSGGSSSAILQVRKRRLWAWVMDPASGALI